jgi:hypothetical protein
MREVIDVTVYVQARRPDVSRYRVMIDVSPRHAFGREHVAWHLGFVINKRPEFRWVGVSAHVKRLLSR